MEDESSPRKTKKNNNSNSANIADNIDAIPPANEKVRYYNLHDFPHNSIHRKRLYIPNNPHHPAWDCIYDDGETTAFFSFSISDFAKGGDKDHQTTTLKSFRGGIFSVNLSISIYLSINLSYSILIYPSI